MNHYRYLRYIHKQLSPNSEFDKPCLTLSSAWALTRHRDAGFSPDTDRYDFTRKKMWFKQKTHGYTEKILGRKRFPAILTGFPPTPQIQECQLGMSLACPCLTHFASVTSQNQDLDQSQHIGLYSHTGRHNKNCMSFNNSIRRTSGRWNWDLKALNGNEYSSHSHSAALAPSPVRNEIVIESIIACLDIAVYQSCCGVLAT